MKQWQKAEKKDATLFKTKQQKGSGNQDHYPTDSFSDDFAVDSKYTEKNSYSISVDTWTKLLNETAFLDMKDEKMRVPLLSLHLQKFGLHLVVMGYEDFARLEEDAWKYRDLST